MGIPHLLAGPLPWHFHRTEGDPMPDALVSTLDRTSVPDLIGTFLDGRSPSTLTAYSRRKLSMTLRHQGRTN